MAKKISAYVKLQLPAGKASPAQKVGQALGARGVNIMAFCKEFNARTQNQAGDDLPTVITIYADKSFTFVTKTPPVSQMIQRATGVQKGSKVPGKEVAGQITQAQLLDIAQKKFVDLNAYDLEAARKIVAGSARSMGLEIVD